MKKSNNIIKQGTVSYDMDSYDNWEKISFVKENSPVFETETETFCFDGESFEIPVNECK